jgi:hypothetical protein
LKISNNCMFTLNWINQTFGGRTTLLNKKTRDKTRNFITYDCYFTGNCLTDLTEMLLPYLILKLYLESIYLIFHFLFQQR